MLSKLSVKKPFTVVVAIVLVIILGVVSYTHMSLDLIPSINLPYAVVTTTYVGASPEQVEQTVTSPIEQGVASINNAKEITSISAENVSMVIIEFNEDTNMDSATIEIREKLDQISGNFPDTVSSPTILKINPNMLPIVSMAVSVDGMSDDEAAVYIEEKILPELESTPGVASVNANGLVQNMVDVTLSGEKIQALNDSVAVFFQEESEDQIRQAAKEAAYQQIDESIDQQRQALLNQTISSEMADEILAPLKEQAYAQVDQELQNQRDQLVGQSLSAETVEQILTPLREQAYAQVDREMDALRQELEQQGLPQDQVDQQVETARQEGYAQADQQLQQLEDALLSATVTPELADQLMGFAKEIAYAQVDQEFQNQKEQLMTQGLPQDQVDAQLEQAREEAYAQVDGQLESIVQQQLSQFEFPEVDVTAEMITAILSGENFSMPAGTVGSEDGSQYVVRVGDKIESLEELENLKLMEIPEYGPVYLKDIADIQTYDNTGTIYSRVNGNYAITLTMQKQPNYSTADVANWIQERTAQISQEHPDVHFDVLMDQGEYVDLMINAIMKNLLSGAVLAILILYIFLRQIKPTVIVGASILISVVTAFVLMYFSGITLNMISMSGLALGVGMLVDNSIVVIENIYRMRSQGVPARKAAIEGAKEVAGAITSSTITTVIVFVPIVFTEGITRQLFTDMALTITFSLLASLVVALTLVPAASAHMLRKNFKQKKTFMDRVSNTYTKLLDKALNHRWAVVALSVVLLVGSVAAALTSGTQLFPEMDSGSITISVEMPDTASQEEIFQGLDDLSQALTDVKDIQTVGILYSDSGSSSGMMGLGGGTTVYVTLQEDRTSSTNQVIEEIREKTQDLPFEVTASSSNMDLSMLSGGEIVVNVYGRELDDLHQVAQEVTNLVASVEGTTEVENSMGDPQEELRIRVDKEKAIDHGLTVAQVYQAVAQKLAVTSSTTTITDGDTEYSLYVRDDREEALTQESLSDFQVSNTSGESVALGDIATIEMGEGFSTIQRQDQERYVQITGSLKEGYTTGQVGQAIESKLESYDFPAGCRYEMSGESQTIQESFQDLYLMLALAIVFIYLVMVAQFQSLLSPFIVMFTIPLAFTGGFLGLFFAGMPVSVITLIGLVVLVGIVVNNGIVFVDYANQLMERGYSKREALLQTGHNRLRPILMTALTTIIALVGMVFDTSTGAELMQPMAVTVIGGLTYSTLLTLFLVPCMYDLLRRKRPHWQDEEDEETQEAITVAR